jgi:hypothetical protein
MSRQFRPNYRYRTAALLCGIWAVTSLAIADPPSAPEPAVDGRALGLAEGLFAYCTHANPQSADVLQAHIDELVKDTPKETVARLRETGDYREAYDGITKFAAAAPPQNAKLLCSGGASNSE